MGTIVAVVIIIVIVIVIIVVISIGILVQGIAILRDASCSFYSAQCASTMGKLNGLGPFGSRFLLGMRSLQRRKHWY